MMMYSSRLFSTRMALGNSVFGPAAESMGLDLYQKE